MRTTVLSRWSTSSRTGQPNPTLPLAVLHPYRFNEGDGPALTNDISEDGSRIFWTDLNNNNLYVRENGSSTVQVDAGVGGGGKFWAASPDGATVLFVKAGDLYEFDLETAQTTDLTPGGEVQGIVGTSKDLSYVYFVADAALAPGAAHVECHGESLCNLYALHVGEPARLVAQLAYKDNESRQSFEARVYGDWQSGAGDKEAEATPDGKHLCSPLLVRCPATNQMDKMSTSTTMKARSCTALPARQPA